ncbi:MAG: TIGR01777 family oxidoreductase, partial [Desulfobacteraceae bacterium]
MDVAITGGTGFVGTYLCRHLLNAGHRVTAIGSRTRYRLIDHDRFTFVSADTTRPGAWQQVISEADLVFNLAGRTIFRRWTRHYKQQIFDSRILTTRYLVEALPDSTQTVLVSTSAVGYYGDCGDTELTESSPPGRSYLAAVSKDWEREAKVAEAKGARVVIARFGIVLGAHGGALGKMIPPFRSFVGGPLGNGQQWFPWIHIQDMVEALEFVASGSDRTGPFNLCAPHPVRNRAMAAALGKVLGRPAGMPAPAFMLKMMMGELAG